MKRRSRVHVAKQVDRTKPAKDATMTADEIERHIASLVAIADCTGARTLARTVDAEELAQKTFDRCIGLKTEAPAGVEAATSVAAPPVDLARTVNSPPT